MPCRSHGMWPHVLQRCHGLRRSSVLWRSDERRRPSRSDGRRRSHGPRRSHGLLRSQGRRPPPTGCGDPTGGSISSGAEARRETTSDAGGLRSSRHGQELLSRGCWRYSADHRPCRRRRSASGPPKAVVPRTNEFQANAAMDRQLAPELAKASISQTCPRARLTRNQTAQNGPKTWPTARPSVVGTRPCSAGIAESPLPQVCRPISCAMERRAMASCKEKTPILSSSWRASPSPCSMRWTRCAPAPHRLSSPTARPAMGFIRRARASGRNQGWSKSAETWPRNGKYLADLLKNERRSDRRCPGLHREISQVYSLQDG